MAVANTTVHICLAFMYEYVHTVCISGSEIRHIKYNCTFSNKERLGFCAEIHFSFGFWDSVYNKAESASFLTMFFINIFFLNISLKGLCHEIFYLYFSCLEPICAVWRIQNVLMWIRIPLFMLMRIRIQNFSARVLIWIWIRIHGKYYGSGSAKMMCIHAPDKLKAKCFD